MDSSKIPALVMGACLWAAPALVSAQAPGTDPKALFDEAGKAFTTKDYATAVTKIEQLLTIVTDPKDERRELLLFNLGLANMLAGKNPEALRAFKATLAGFPEGEYASRAALGIGKSAMAIGGKPNQEDAIKALKIAARDPKYRAEAGLALGQVYSDTGQKEAALKIFRSLMGSDIRTPAQTAASVEAVGLLAKSGQIENLVAYMDRLNNQSGVQDAIAWFSNQVIVKGDEMLGEGKHDAALAIYRAVLPRQRILEIQAATLAEKKSELALLKENVKKIDDKVEANTRRIQAINELISSYEGLITQVEEAVTAITKLPDLDAALLMRRGRCFFYSDRKEEALLCFSTLREKYPNTADAKTAAFAEIVIHNQFRNVDKIQPLGEAYLKKYPDAENAEQVATLVGEIIALSNDWGKVLAFYKDLESRYPNSASVDRFVFFQGVAMFQNGDFNDAAALFERFLKTYPQSQLQEQALYRVAMSYFLTNNYKKTLEWCREYLNRYPDGMFYGDVLYRLAFIDSQDREKNQSEKIVKTLSDYLERKPEDAAAGPMSMLLGDTLQKLKTSKDMMKVNEDRALVAYKRAVWSTSPDEIIQSALESATAILQSRQDWQGIVDLHGRFMKERSDNQMAMLSATWVSKGMQRLGKPEEGAKILSDALSGTLGDPSREQVELLIHEIVRSLVPKRRGPDFDPAKADQRLQEILNRAAAGKENATTSARIIYARAFLYDSLRNTTQKDQLLKSIANSDAIDPAALSPMLLAVCGEILIKDGKLDRAETMFQRLTDRYKNSTFSDAGPVGLGQIALARKKPDEAYRIFEDALVNNAGTSRFKEATIGKLEALRDLGKFDEAEKLAVKIAGDRAFRGPSIPKIYIILGDSMRMKAKKVSAEEGAEILRQAHGYYQRAYTGYQRELDLTAEAYYKACEVLKEIGNTELYQETLKQFLAHPKLAEAQPAFWRKAQELKGDLPAAP